MSDRTIREEIGHALMDALEDAKSDVSRWIRMGKQVEQDCRLYGNAVFRMVDGVIERVDPADVVFKIEVRDGDVWPHRELTDAEEQAEERTWD